MSDNSTKESTSVCLDTKNINRKPASARGKRRLYIILIIIIITFVTGIVYFIKKASKTDVSSVPTITSVVGDREVSHDNGSVYEYISDSALEDVLMYVGSLEQEGYICTESIGNELVIMEKESGDSGQISLIEIRIGANGYTIKMFDGNGVSGADPPVVLEKTENPDTSDDVAHQKRMDTMAQNLERDRGVLNDLYYGSSMTPEQYIYLSQLLENRYRCHELILMLVYEMQSNNSKAIIPLVQESLSVILEANEIAIPESIVGYCGEEIEIMLESYSNAAQAMQGFLQSDGQESYNNLFLSSYNDAIRSWENILGSIQQHFN